MPISASKPRTKGVYSKIELTGFTDLTRSRQIAYTILYSRYRSSKERFWFVVARFDTFILKQESIVIQSATEKKNRARQI